MLNLIPNTIGAVIGSETSLEIVPRIDNLVVDARVALDIDRVCRADAEVVFQCLKMLI